jgi:hypothetical protein
VKSDGTNHLLLLLALRVLSSPRSPEEELAGGVHCEAWNEVLQVVTRVNLILPSIEVFGRKERRIRHLEVNWVSLTQTSLAGDNSIA